MSYNPKKLFNEIQKKEQDNATNRGNGVFGNPLIFKPKVGTTYAVRLLWLPPISGCDREYPMINSFIHRIWDENANGGQKENKVICPTSQYLMGESPAAFKRCPICEAASTFYKQGQEGSESANELYSKFRRTCFGYVPVYIVNGPDEDIHQVKILQYGKQFKDFFDNKIFGIKKQNKFTEQEIDTNIDDEAIGLDAFMYYDESADQIVTSGYDLLITTTTKKMKINGKQVDMPQYQLDFTRKLRNIKDIDGIDLDSEEGLTYFNSLNEHILHFDSDFYIKSTEAELQNFKLNYITGNTALNTEEIEMHSNRPTLSLPKKANVIKSEDDEPDEIPMGNSSEQNSYEEVDEEPEQKVRRKSPKVDRSDELTDDIPRTASGEIDIDSLIGEFN